MAEPQPRSPFFIPPFKPRETPPTADPSPQQSSSQIVALHTEELDQKDADKRTTCQHCGTTLSSRTKLMKHVFTVCRPPEPPVTRQQHSTLQSHYDILLEEHTALENATALLRKQEQRLQDDNNNKLQDERNTLSIKCESLSVQNKTFQTNNQALTEDNKELVGDNIKLQDELDTLSADCESLSVQNKAVRAGNAAYVVAYKETLRYRDERNQARTRIEEQNVAGRSVREKFEKLIAAFESLEKQHDRGMRALERYVEADPRARRG